ncbi:protein mab-21-like 3 isoform X3 [Heptranchias perlo]|uniref:protein mab-21-like 3 isoform X3 n=1 Tax=Heptranchias perlo TaxID=212740 RepID=UPI003559C5A8
MVEFTEEDLDFYLHNQVDLHRRQISKTEEEVYAIVQELTCAISKEDSRFQPISHSGINNDNIKVQSPTQLFIMVPVRGLAAYTERKVRQWRYYTLSGSKLISPVREPEKLHQWLEVDQFLKSTQEWHQSDVTIEGDIVPSKVVAILKALLEKPIQASNFHRKINVLESVGPNIRLAVETTEQHVEVEMVPAIEIANHWPKKARWPRLLKRWPSKEKARTAKTLLFWTCEKYPRSKDWKNFQKCFLRLVKKLEKCVLQRYLRHYFVMSYNLLKYANTNELDITSQKINDFLMNPGVHFH